MKTTLFLLVSLFFSVSAVSARTTTKISNSDSTAQTQNGNQIQTQNAGQDKKIEVQNMEILDESSEASDEAKNNEKIINNHGQQVSTQVKLLLQSKLASQSGIGQQVREIAQKQVKTQETIQQGIDKINARPGWFKRFFGTNQSALNSLDQQLNQNQLDIEELSQLQTTVSNQADADMIQTTLQSLIDQNTSLAQTIQVEQKRKGFFSWFSSLLAR